jgi:hypothetical protein
MDFQTWAEWVAEIDAITGGAVVELQAAPHGALTFRVRWRVSHEQFGCAYMLSRLEIKYMKEAAQPQVLNRIAHEVRKIVFSHNRKESNMNARAMPTPQLGAPYAT